MGECLVRQRTGSVKSVQSVPKKKKTPTKNYQLSIINYQLKKSQLKNEQRNLEQDPEHRDHRTYRHRHHLRGDLLHGRVDNKRAQPLWNALSFKHSTLLTL